MWKAVTKYCIDRIELSNQEPSLPAHMYQKNTNNSNHIVAVVNSSKVFGIFRLLYLEHWMNHSQGKEM